MTSALVLRAAAASGALLLWIGLCVICLRAARRGAVLAAPASSGSSGWLIAYASQTGTGHELALQTERRLAAAGVASHVTSLGTLSEADLRGATRALFIASTYGEGDPPDEVEAFLAVMARAVPLTAVRFAVLALGSSEYTNFCGFGRALTAWLLANGARPMFESIDVDNLDPIALARWNACLGEEVAQVGGDSAAWEAADPEPVVWTRWRLSEQRLLNSGSAGAPMYAVALTPDGQSPLPTWQSGDLLQIIVPADPGRPRDYSLASLPDEGVARLLVRQERRADGSSGVASHWLTTQCSPAAEVLLRIRPHPGFRLGANAERPLLLIGNGTGLAGLIGHLKARANAGQHRNWLVFGERQAEFDRPCHEQLAAWRAQGVLQRLDLVYSRDSQTRRYVQHALLEAADDVRHWLGLGAAIYVCGSLQGMAAGVDATLKEIAGADTMAQLARDGRYRRDVY